MFKAVYQGKPGSRIRIVHELGTFQFEGGVEIDVPDEVGRFLRHITKTKEVKTGFFVIDLSDLMNTYGDPSRVEIPVRKKKKKKKKVEEKTGPLPMDKERHALKKIKRLRREA